MPSILPKKELKNVNFCPSLLGQECFVRFLGEVKKPKSPFEINWPLADIMQTHFFQNLRPKIENKCLHRPPVSLWQGIQNFVQKLSRIFASNACPSMGLGPKWFWTIQITVNRNGILASKTAWHEILLRYIIFAYHWTS